MGVTFKVLSISFILKFYTKENPLESGVDTLENDHQLLFPSHPVDSCWALLHLHGLCFWAAHKRG